MKYFLFCCLTLATFTLAAQKSSSSVKETNTEDGRYEFEVKLDKKRVGDLVEAFAEVTKADFAGGFSGTAAVSTYGNALVSIDTKKRTITVVNEDDHPKSLLAAREMAARIKRLLRLEPTPTPPSID